MLYGLCEGGRSRYYAWERQLETDENWWKRTRICPIRILAAHLLLHHGTAQHVSWSTYACTRISYCQLRSESSGKEYMKVFGKGCQWGEFQRELCIKTDRSIYSTWQNMKPTWLQRMQISFPHVISNVSARFLSSFVALSLMPKRYSVSSPKIEKWGIPLLKQLGTSYHSYHGENFQYLSFPSKLMHMASSHWKRMLRKKDEEPAGGGRCTHEVRRFRQTRLMLAGGHWTDGSERLQAVAWAYTWQLQKVSHN